MPYGVCVQTSVRYLLHFISHTHITLHNRATLRSSYHCIRKPNPALNHIHPIWIMFSAPFLHYQWCSFHSRALRFHNISSGKSGTPSLGHYRVKWHRVTAAPTPPVLLAHCLVFDDCTALRSGSNGSVTSSYVVSSEMHHGTEFFLDTSSHLSMSTESQWLRQIQLIPHLDIPSCIDEPLNCKCSLLYFFHTCMCTENCTSLPAPSTDPNMQNYHEEPTVSWRSTNPEAISSLSAVCSHPISSAEAKKQSSTSAPKLLFSINLLSHFSALFGREAACRFYTLCIVCFSITFDYYLCANWALRHV